MSFRLEVVSDIERLRQLRQAWSDQVSQWGQSTPFHLPEWHLTWWEHFGSGELQTLVAWRGESIVGLVPCFRHIWQGARQLTLIGSGVTDYLDPFIQAGCEPQTISAITHYLEEADCDVCDWQDLSASSPFLRLVDSECLDVWTVPDTVCSEVELRGDFESYWATRSSDMRRNIRRYTEKAEKLAPVSFGVDCNANPDSLEALFSLHTSRWRSRGESGMVEANHSAGFMRAVSAAFSQRGILRLFTLRWFDRVVAVILAFSWKGKLYGYFSAFDPEHERLGFGRTLLFHCVRYAYETKHSHWNFLRGDELYKESWGAQCIPKCRMTIRRREYRCRAQGNP